MPCVLLQALNDFIMEQGSSKSITLQVRTKQHPNQGHYCTIATNILSSRCSLSM